jgi:hypothetical protein
VPDRDSLHAIERRLRAEAPELARALDAFTRDARDPVPHGVAAALAVVAGLLMAGWAATGDPGLLTGAALVLVCTPVAWLVGLGRRPAPGA